VSEEPAGPQDERCHWRALGESQAKEFCQKKERRDQRDSRRIEAQEKGDINKSERKKNISSEKGREWGERGRGKSLGWMRGNEQKGRNAKKSLTKNCSS